MTQKKADGGCVKDAPQDAADPLMAQLKDMYDSVVDEPLPSDLLALLDKLDAAERSR